MIDLSEYTPAVLKFLSTHQLACIYVMAENGHAPSKIGYCENLAKRFYEIQRPQARRITIEHVLWLPDRGRAITVEKKVESMLKNNMMRDGWYDISPALASLAVDEAIQRFFPGMKILKQSDLATLSRRSPSGFGSPPAIFAY